MAEWWAVCAVLLAGFMGSFGSLQFKKAADSIEGGLRQIATNKALITGLFIYGGSTVAYVIGLRGGELSVLFPLVSTGYIWTALLSIRFLGERMNRLKWAGIGAIIIGVALIGAGSAQIPV